MRWRTLLGAVISLGLLAFALQFLFKIAQRYRYEDIVEHLHNLPWWQVGIALGLTATSYILLTGYDALALVYLKRKLPYHRTALASFVGYTFSHNLGFALVTGSSVRYRLYSLWGLNAGEIAQLVMFCSITFFLGLFFAGGLAVVISPPALPPGIDLPPWVLNSLGWVALATALSYFLIPVFWRKPIVLRGVEIRSPGFRISVLQYLIAGLDWVLAAGVLYALLPPETRPDFLQVLPIFMAGNILGVMLHVPGGIGIFEGVVTFLLKDHIPEPQILGALIAYRVAYYVLPFITALLLFGGHELLQLMKRAHDRVQPESRGFLATMLGLAVFACGAIVLFSGATPTHLSRLVAISEVVPLWLLETTHFFAALGALLMILLARSLVRQSQNAFKVALWLLPFTALLAFTKGMQILVLVPLVLVWLALMPSGVHFHRQRSVIRSPFSTGWLMAIGSVVLISLWLTYFSYREVPSGIEPFTQIALLNEKARSWRSLLSIPLAIIIVALVRTFRSPLRQSVPAPNSAQLDQILLRSRTALAQLSRLGDKRFICNPDYTAFVMYVANGRSLIALGDPVGDEPEHLELLWQFRERADHVRRRPVIFMARPEKLSTYYELNLVPHKLGQEAVIDLAQLDQHIALELAEQHKTVFAQGFRIEVLSADKVAALLPEMKSISDRWMDARELQEQGFVLGQFDANYLMQLPHAMLYWQDKLVGFASLMCSGDQRELSVDLLRHESDLPDGWLVSFYIALFRWASAEGYQRFCFGLAPVTDWSDHPLAALWSKIGHTLMRHARHVEQPDAVREFKEKFRPVWEDRYLITSSTAPLPQVLADVSELMSREPLKQET